MEVKRRLAAILAADVVGYSRLMGQDEVGTLKAIKDLMIEEVRPRVAEHKGRVVKTMGDGFLASFGSVFEAFQCALKLQKAAAARAQGVAAERQIVMRIGINIGDIIHDGGDVFGDGVNIAARLESLAQPGGICVSSRAWEDLRKLDLKFTDMGDLRLKNIAQPVRAYAFLPTDPYVGASPEAKGEPTAEAPGVLRRALHPTLAAGVVAAIAAGVVAVAMQPTKPKPLELVRAETGAMPCSWLRVSDQSSVDGVEVFKLSGSSATPPAKISAAVLDAARRKRVDVDQVIAADVAPLYPSQCGWIDKLKGFRYAGIPRFALSVKPMGQGMTQAALTLDAADLGAAGAVYGIEPSGAVVRIVDKADLEKMGMPKNPDGSYTLNLDIDHVGWNGVVLMEAKTPAPEGVIERTAQTDAERRAFEAQAKAGGWRFELAWFRVGD